MSLRVIHIRAKMLPVSILQTAWNLKLQFSISFST